LLYKCGRSIGLSQATRQSNATKSLAVHGIVDCDQQTDDLPTQLQFSHNNGIRFSCSGRKPL